MGKSGITRIALELVRLVNVELVYSGRITREDGLEEEEQMVKEKAEDIATNGQMNGQSAEGDLLMSLCVLRTLRSFEIRLSWHFCPLLFLNSLEFYLSLSLHSHLFMALLFFSRKPSPISVFAWWPFHLCLERQITLGEKLQTAFPAFVYRNFTMIYCISFH